MYEDGPKMEMVAAMEDVRPSMTDTLKRQRSHLVSELERVDAAIAAIESNPSVQTVLDALAKLGKLRM